MNTAWILVSASIVGIILLVGICLTFMWRSHPKFTEDHLTKEQIGVPSHWQGIVPDQTKYKLVSELRDSIDLGLQAFSFEYGLDGHTQPLTLPGAIVRADVQFTCRITNPYKADFSANEFALNVLPPIFLVQAREILEGYSLSELRSRRENAAKIIVKKLTPQFEEFGVKLETVTIGSLEKIG